MTAQDRIRRLRSAAREQKLVVLVWGPGDPGPNGSPEIQKFWAKRCQIREVLSARFPNSQILFSESDVLRDLTRDLNDLLAEEAVHAAIADCILVLDVARGAHVEVDRFASLPDVACKMTVLLPEKFPGNAGLAKHVHSRVNARTFSNAELDRCDVATVMSPSIVDVSAIQKLLGPTWAN
jgi:hypothetical protein